MKFIICIFLFIISTFGKVFAITNIIDNGSNQKITDGFGNEIAYKIYVAGSKTEYGKKNIGKVYSIPKLPKSEYMSGRIHIKTKNYYSLSNRFNSISRILRKSIGQENIVRIDAPYDRFASEPLKQFDRYGISRIYELTYSSDIDAYDLCKELMKDADVEYAVPIFMRYYHDFTPNDPERTKQWALTKMQSYKSWDISKGDSSIIIAITDSGVEYTHEDLSSNMWVNKKEKPNDGVDNDGNGYVDDYLGWDFVGSITASQAVQGQWKPDNDPKPGHFHGTHVAGCAAAAGNNGKGVVGPGFQCKIMALKCGTDASNSTGIFRGYDAILYAAQMGAHIINCSWGGPGGSPAEQELINTAYNLGSVIVVSAGNSFKNIDYGNSYPAGYDNVLCVGATRNDDTKAWFTNYGYLVDVYGPGENIYATMPGGNRYGYQSGTSMSAPVVSGVCGQLKALHPDWSQKQIMHQIRSTSENVITTDPALRPMYYGRVNAYNAMSYNNTKLPTYEKIPGISVSKILSQGVEVLTDYQPASFTIEIMNYLSIARRTKVKISALQKYVSVSVSQIDVGTIEQMGRDTFDLVVRLLESAPWYEGKVDILLQYESDSYIDYEIIQLPIKLETKNKFTLNYVFPETDLPLWYSATSLSKDNIMLVGARQSTGYGIFYRNNLGYNTNQITQRPLYCLYNYDENTFYAGSGGNPTNIIKSENGGQSWIVQDVSSITNFINDIYFFDNLEGVFAGDPSGGSWGVGITTNGGQSWSKSNKLPSVLSGESAYAGCGYGVGNNYWFGTNKGRVVFTRDRGKNWQSVTVKSNGFIHKLLFLDGLIGVAIYGNSQTDSERKLAVTWDGGFNWTTDRFNFGKSLGVSPIYLYKPKDATLIIALCSGGEIYSSKDYGQSWQPILSQKFSTVSFGAAYGEFGECRIWSGETELTYLDFEYMPDNAKKTLQLNPSGNIAFGDVEANKSKTITVTITNTGNMNVNIDSTKIVLSEGVYEEEFRITFPVTGKIGVNESKTLRVKFNPLKEGLRKAELVIYSNADVKTQKVNLTGNGTNAVRKISFVGDTVVNFDSVEVGSYKEIKIKYQNTGNVVLKVNQLELKKNTNPADFAFNNISEFEIMPGSVSEVSMSFSPEQVGKHEAEFIVQSETEDAIIKLIGIAVEPISVEDMYIDKILVEELYPNPCSDELYIKIVDEVQKGFNNATSNYVLRITDIYGNERDRFTFKTNDLLKISTEKLENGVYFIELLNSIVLETRKFLIIK